MHIKSLLYSLLSCRPSRPLSMLSGRQFLSVALTCVAHSIRGNRLANPNPLSGVLGAPMSEPLQANTEYKVTLICSEIKKQPNGWLLLALYRDLDFGLGLLNRGYFSAFPQNQRRTSCIPFNLIESGLNTNRIASGITGP